MIFSTYSWVTPKRNTGKCGQERDSEGRAEATNASIGERRRNRVRAAALARQPDLRSPALIDVGTTNTEGSMFKFLRNVFILREIWRMFKRSRRA
jgi:hypothetical protein